MAKSDKKSVSTTAVTSRKLGRATHYAERLYWRVYLASDVYGVLRGDPWDVLLTCAPGVNGATLENTAAALDELAELGLIERWVEPEGKIEGTQIGGAWISVCGHDRHHTKEHLRKRGKRRSPVPPSERKAGLAERHGSERPAKMEERPATAHQVEEEEGEDNVLDLSARQAYANLLAARDRSPEARAQLEHVTPEAFQEALDRGTLNSLGLTLDVLVDVPLDPTPANTLEVPPAPTPRTLLTRFPNASGRDLEPGGPDTPLGIPGTNQHRHLSVVTGLEVNGAHSADHHSDGPVPA